MNVAAEQLKLEETTQSRLFAVDVARDSGELRAKYPDRARYAIVRGRVRLNAYAGSATREPQLYGYLEVINDHVNVPPEFAPVFDALSRAYGYNPYQAAPVRYEVTLAFGRRFEPWIAAASAGQ